MKVIKAFFSGLSTKERKILYVAGLFILLAIFDRLIVGPFTKESESLLDSMTTQIKMAEKNKRILQYKEKITDEDDQLAPYYVSEGLTQEELTASFLSEVEEFAKSSGITIVNLNPVEVKEEREHEEYSLTVECTGSMSDILDFFYSTSSAKKPVRVASCMITAKDRDNYMVKCSLTIVKMILIKPGVKMDEGQGDTLLIKEKITLG